MANRGVQEFYYTRELPTRSVAIAQVSTAPTSPAQLTDINNAVFLPGNLEIRKSLTLDTSPADFVAPALMQTVAITGTTTYRVYNQFFELTNILLPNGNPGYYVHTLPAGVNQGVTILDINGNAVNTSTLQSGSFLYHTLDGAPYFVRYIDGSGFLRTDLLTYTPVLTIAPFQTSATTYTLSGRFLSVSTSGTYYLRFTAQNGYQALQPYNSQPNTPWYTRIRFSLTPVAPEWATQLFLPQRPYVLASWVPGIVLSNNLIEFERKQIFSDPTHLPDVLVYDQNFNIKYALDGSAPGSPLRKGTLFSWRRGLITAVDAYKARVQVAVILDPTDLVFGFYSYLEPDVVYRNLDMNPFTNPAVSDKVIQFYYKSNGQDLLHFIYHQIIDPITGRPVAGATNDPAPNTGTNNVFATVSVGVGVGPQSFTVTDVRTRGGGLAPAWQSLPQAVNFWDLGFWDGKPYPIGGALAVYVPASILNNISSTDVQGRVAASLPAGTLAVIHYYNPDGSEIVV